MKNFKINQSECVGCSTCALIAPTNFAMNSSNVAYINTQPKTEDEEAECSQALEICPVQVISAV